MRPRDRTCKLCEYANWFAQGPGECRFMAPDSTMGWPKVWPTDWCGSHLMISQTAEPERT